LPKLVLLLAGIAVFYILLKRVQGLPPHQRRAETTKIAIGAAVVVVIMLTLAGKMHWVGAALTGLLVIMRQSLPLLLRLFPVLAQWRQQRARAGGGGKSSTVTTRILAMYLDHESGQLSGEVLQGAFAQWRLDEMDRGQLNELRDYCLREDPESVQLLDSYLEQRFPDEEPAGGDTGNAVDSGGMNRREAMQILGVDEDASQEDIVTAHRKLMQKLHPDRGGSDYLAAKINEAKDFLLGHN